MINDDVFWTAVYNTLYYTALAVPIGVVVAMVLALAMNQPLPEVPIFRAIIYIPSIIPLFTLAFIYQVLMNPTQGIFNRILIWFGLPNINWFGDPDLRQARAGDPRPVWRRAGGDRLSGRV